MKIIRNTTPAENEEIGNAADRTLLQMAVKYGTTPNHIFDPDWRMEMEVITDDGARTTMAAGRFSMSGIITTFVGTAKAHPDDEFDYELGKQIAASRAFAEISESLADIAVAYAEVKNIEGVTLEVIKET